MGTACAVLLSTFSLIAFIAPNASAAAKTWTTDTDFDDPTAIFTSTEVVGTGVDAKVELIKDNTDWRNMNPSAPPDPREGPGAAFSMQGNRTVLFGGYSSLHVGELADTWEYDYPSNTWTMYSPNPNPDGREFARMSYDPDQKVIVLYGGINNSAPKMYLSDTWEYDVVSRTWTETYPDGPLMDSSAMAYDSTAKVHIMVGRNYTTGLFQTWAYDATANSWTLRTTGGPAARTGHAIAYHESLKRTVLFGGFDSSVPPGTLLADAWEYNYASNSWSSVGGAGPSARRSHSMTYDNGLASVILFGGKNSSRVTNDTWRYTNSRTWILFGVGAHPPDRQMAALTYDVRSDAVILFGGSDAGSSQLGDTWSFEASHRAAGKYTSPVFDSTCGNVDWKNLSWNKAVQPPNTFLRFMLATSDLPSGPWNFYGPGGSMSVYYTITPFPIWTGHDNHRFLRFLGDFGTYDSHVTPSLEDLTIDFYCPPSPPYIVNTNPGHMQRDVPTLRPINVTFSEAMNPSTVTWQFLRGTSVPLTPNWSGGNTFLSLTHTQPFPEATLYEIKIMGKDLDGIDLVVNPSNPSIVNPWMFITVTTYPVIAATNPMQGDLFVPLAADVIIDFSEPMNTSSVQWNITPSITHSGTWTSGDSRLVLAHSEEFHNCTYYKVEVTQGEDKSGILLIPGPAPNPWSFLTACINPFVMETRPADFQSDVALGYAISVTFSEPMDIATVNLVFIKGPRVLLSPTWSDANRKVTLAHSQAFQACTAYEVRIQGQDLDGYPIIPSPMPPGSPNPWRFMTFCGNPSIIGSSPKNGTNDVGLNQDVQFIFSMGMDEASVEVTFNPSIIKFESYWNPPPDPPLMMTITNLSLEQCTEYLVHVTKGRSLGGLDLVPGMVPNPISFRTICDRPYVVSTDPINGTLHVPLDKNVVVQFSRPMNTTAFVFALDPDVAGKSLTWSNGNRTLVVSHSTDFTTGTKYMAFVDGMDVFGNNLVIAGPMVPNPWLFTTRYPGFYIASTDPADGETEVPLGSDIVVDFTEPADPLTFTHGINPPIMMSSLWGNGNRRITLSHSTQFDECTWYDISVDARDMGGNPLITVPGSAANPWQFRAKCVMPQIVSADPPDGAMAVPLDKSIVVTFSETMDTATVHWALIPPDVTFTPSWSGGDTVLTLGHAAALMKSTTYLIAITGNDTDGNGLAVGPSPNPWYFTTLGDAPQSPGGLAISRLPPSTIRLTWRQVPNADVYRIYESSDRFAPFPWGIVGTTATESFDINHLDDGLDHYYIVRAVSLGTEGPNSTMAVKIAKSIGYSPSSANIYWFSLPYRSPYAKASDVSAELTSARISVVAKWDAARQGPLLWYFFRGKWRGMDFAVGAGDGLYVGSVSSFSWVIVGTDGPVTLNFTFNSPPKKNLNWISMPYTGACSRASEIVMQIEGSLGPSAHTKITEVAMWDPLAQAAVRFAWTATGWSGTDFTFSPGAGISISIVASFTWTPTLVTPEVP